MTNSTETIRSERLDMQPLTVADADEMVAVLADPRLYAFIGGEPPTVDDLRDRYRRLATGHSADGLDRWHNWIVRTREDGRAIGTVQATIGDGGSQAAIAWVIGGPWQGHGFASEAAVALVGWLVAHGVSSVTANIHADHLASAAVAARAGLEATDEFLDGERVWRLQPSRNEDSSTRTDESR